MTGDAQEKTLDALKASGVLASLKRYEIKGESTALPHNLTAEGTVKNKNQAAAIGASTDKTSVHAQRSTMIVRIEELLTSYGLDPNKKAGLLAALDRLHTAHTNAEILAAVADVSSIVTAAETSIPETAAPITFADFEKKFDAAWGKYDRLEKETRTTMEEAARAGYISKDDEDRSKQEQRNIKEHKKALDVLRADINKMPEGEQKEKAFEDARKKTLELAKEISQHVSHDEALINQAIEVANRDHNYALITDLKESLPKKIEQRQTGEEMYEFATTSAFDKREAAIAKMRRDEQHEHSTVVAKPADLSTDTDNSAVPPKPITASEDLPEVPPKPLAFTTANASPSLLGALSSPTPGVVSKSSSNGIV